MTNETVKNIVAHIQGVLNPEYDVIEYAEAMFENDDVDEIGHYEVSGAHTISGSPYSFFLI